MSTDSISNPRQRNWAWIWFAYTGFLFLQPILEPALYLWLGTLAALASFVAIYSRYARAYDRGQPMRFWMIGATFALGLVCFPWNQGASTFFVYAAAFLPFSIASVRRVLYLFLLECIAILAEGYAFSVFAPRGPFHIGWPNVFIAIFLVLIIGGGNIFFAEQKRADCKLRAALEENLALAAVAERERIARDLHDVLGHTLSVIVLKAELAGRLIPLDPARALAEMSDVELIARSALAEIREAIGGYRARGLAAELPGSPSLPKTIPYPPLASPRKRKPLSPSPCAKPSPMSFATPAPPPAASASPPKRASAASSSKTTASTPPPTKAMASAVCASASSRSVAVSRSNLAPSRAVEPV